MGMFYCPDCKTERQQTTCPVCGVPTYKRWWTFPRDDKHPNVAHGYKVYYKQDGSIEREEPY